MQVGSAGWKKKVVYELIDTGSFRVSDIFLIAIKSTVTGSEPSGRRNRRVGSFAAGSSTVFWQFLVAIMVAQLAALAIKPAGRAV
jgi:hypothetical protein